MCNENPWRNPFFLHRVRQSCCKTSPGPFWLNHEWEEGFYSYLVPILSPKKVGKIQLLRCHILLEHHLSSEVFRVKPWFLETRHASARNFAASSNGKKNLLVHHEWCFNFKVKIWNFQVGCFCDISSPMALKGATPATPSPLMNQSPSLCRIEMLWTFSYGPNHPDDFVEQKPELTLQLKLNICFSPPLVQALRWYTPS